MSDFAALTASLDRACIATLGETIQYAADGANFLPVEAYTDYRDGQASFDNATFISQDIGIALLKADVPAKPGPAVRITLPLRAGDTYRPVNVRTDQSGSHWEFEVQRV